MAGFLPKYITNRYQDVKSNTVIKINATLPLRPNHTSAISYLLGTACFPHQPPPFFLMISVGCACSTTYLASYKACVGRRLGSFH